MGQAGDLDVTLGFVPTGLRRGHPGQPMGEGTVFSTRGVGRLDGHMQEGETEWLTATSFPSLSVLEARSRSPGVGGWAPSGESP